MLTEFLDCKPFRVFPAPGIRVQCGEILRFLNESSPSKLVGRKPLLEGIFQGRECLLRRFHHGGVFRGISRDRYIGFYPRALAELELLSKLDKNGLPVVSPAFALTQRMKIGYRQALATFRLGGGEDLAELKSVSTEHLIVLVELLERFFDAGLLHPDLNIKNILWVAESKKFFLLDFDRAVLLPRSLEPARRQKIYQRLFRSFDKLGKFHFWEGFPFEVVPDYVGEAMKNYRKIRGIRAFFWKLNRK